MSEQQYGMVVKNKKFRCLKFDTKRTLNNLHSFGWYETSIQTNKSVSTIYLERETEYEIPAILFPEFLFYVVNGIRKFFGFFAEFFAVVLPPEQVHSFISNFFEATAKIMAAASSIPVSKSTIIGSLFPILSPIKYTFYK